MKISIGLKRNLLAVKTRRMSRIGSDDIMLVAALRDELRDNVMAYDEHVYNCETCE